MLDLLLNVNPNKSPGPDGIHPKALKELAEILAKPLTIIFNTSIQTGIVPDLWKIGNIIALFKKGDKSDPGNYRPVSLTSVVGKLMEKIVRKVIVNHMIKNDLYSKKQFGFISGRSTTLQLLLVMEEWTEILDKGGAIDTIYMDFMKAFDKVPHKRLITKLESYGLSNQIIKWVDNFLNERNQKVTVNGNESCNRPVTSRIPQGSVLGPILFVIYINDLPECVEANTYLFADDTKIFREIKTEEDRKHLQDDLDKLQQWSDTWLLKFHPNKCKVMSISNKRLTEVTTTYYLHDQDGKSVELSRSEGEKDLGVMVDDKVNFDKHIQQQVNKANSIMGLIRRTYTFLDETSFRYLFQALVRPHLEYAEAVWSPFTKKDIDTIEKVQKRATKLIPSLKNMDYPNRLKKLKMPTLQYRRLRGDMIEVYKIINGIYDHKVVTGFFELSDVEQTRGHNKKLRKLSCKINKRKNYFSNRVIDVWNNLPQEAVSAKSVKDFEIAIDKHWENQEMKYNHNANIELKTGRKRSYTTIQRDDDKIEADKVVDDQRP